MIERLPDPPDRAVDRGVFQWGRYRRPIPSPAFRPGGRLGNLRLKEWCFFSVTHERWFVAFAMVQLGYVANTFCYVVDRRAPSRAWEYDAITPLGAGLRIAPSSVSGSTRWEWRGARIEARWTGAWEVQLDLPLSCAGEKRRLHGAFRVEAEEALALLHPLRKNRPAYTHKAAGMPVSGMLAFGSEEIVLDGALGALDWTRSVALWDTRWKWASLATRAADGRRIGLNLSAEVYDDAEGASRENALFVDGVVHTLPGVDFALPVEVSRDRWRVESREPGVVDLSFTPAGARAQRLDLALVRSDFVQAFGTYEGRVHLPATGPIEIRDAFGVAEDHYARW